ncbi:VOC family protein [Nocardioides sp. NPDC057577]|uniref:VOC family protein n=1 Tax=Nocardioides sp. NPDC057577 TaxID=3346171 RepID=UPI00366E9A03
MDQRISFVTLAVADVAASRSFYVDGLGWTPEIEAEGVLMIRVGEHVILSLWDRREFEEEVGRIASGGDGLAPFTLAHNVATRAEVDAVLELARSLGCEAPAAEERVWGGYTGYFADPDGVRWEIAYNPGPVGQTVLP